MVSFQLSKCAIWCLDSLILCPCPPALLGFQLSRVKLAHYKTLGSLIYVVNESHQRYMRNLGVNNVVPYQFPSLVCCIYGDYSPPLFSFSSYGDFSAYTRQKKHKTYILKPESGCQGKGIWVTKNPKTSAHEHMLCQQYISKVGIFRYMTS